jgi:hypothetical protein
MGTDEAGNEAEVFTMAPPIRPLCLTYYLKQGNITVVQYMNKSEELKTCCRGTEDPNRLSLDLIEG